MLVRQINGIEDLEEAASATTLDPIQLSPGTVNGEFLSAELDDVVLSYGRYQGNFSISGAFCNRNLTFGIMIDCGESVFCSVPILAGAFGVFPAGSDHHAIYHNGVERLMFTIAPDTLQAAAADEGLNLKPGVLTIAKLYQPPEIWGRYLCHQAREIVEQLRQPCEPEGQPLLDRALRDHLVRLALASLDSTGNTKRRHKDLQTNSTGLITETQRWLYAHRGRPCMVDELAHYLNVPRRTLFRTFEKESGLSPGQFIKHFRMSQARRQLALNRNGNQTVTSAATDWGFWQLGQFSKDYRQLFGELPSHTLKKAH